MNYQSMEVISTWGQWIIALGIVIVTLRCIYIIFHMSTSEDNAPSAIIAKVSNHLKALIIMVIAESLTELIKSYFFY